MIKLKALRFQTGAGGERRLKSPGLPAGDSGQQNGPKAAKGEDRRSKRTRHNNKKAYTKVETNDSPKIPDRGKTSEILDLPLGIHKSKKMLCTLGYQYIHMHTCI